MTQPKSTQKHKHLAKNKYSYISWAENPSHLYNQPTVSLIPIHVAQSFHSHLYVKLLSRPRVLAKNIIIQQIDRKGYLDHNQFDIHPEPAWNNWLHITIRICWMYFPTAETSNTYEDSIYGQVYSPDHHSDLGPIDAHLETPNQNQPW
jgi:hypothetical protein